MTVHFEDITVGQNFGPLVKGPMTSAHIMRWSAAIENFHRIHYDRPFAVEHDGLPDILVNGSWKQHVLVQLVKDTLGRGGWLWKLRFRYKSMDIVGTTILARAEIVEKQEIDGLGFVTLRIGIDNEKQVETTAGWAIGVVPLRGGPPVPYPFKPTVPMAALDLPAEV